MGARGCDSRGGEEGEEREKEVEVEVQEVHNGPLIPRKNGRLLNRF